MAEPYTLEEFDVFEGDLDVERLRETVVEMETAWVECARLRRQVSDAQVLARRVLSLDQAQPGEASSEVLLSAEAWADLLELARGL